MSHLTLSIFMLFFAYCLSRFDYKFVNNIINQTFNQGEIFEYLAQRLNIKKATLSNIRDAFDSHVKQEQSNRVGWKKPLNAEQNVIKNKCNPYSRAALSDQAIDILKKNPKNLTHV